MKTIKLFILLLLTLSSCHREGHDLSTQHRGNTTYEGELLGGKREGMGILRQGDAIVYAGMWKGGMRQGEGQTYDAKGRLVEGLWDHDTLVSGRIQTAKYVYEGALDQRMRPHGHGKAQYADGTYYEGMWKQGKRDGWGYDYNKRRLRVGEWKGNSYNGERLNYSADRIYGIDISRHQHEKNGVRFPFYWDRLRITHLGTLSKKNVSGEVNYPVSFIFIKATEGRTIHNAYYASDYAAARQRGYPVGTYHFFSSRSTGQQQAEYFLQHAKVQKGDLPPVLDIEPTPQQIEDMGGVKSMWATVRTWLQIVEKATSMRPILYISQKFVEKYLDAAPDIKQGYPVWIARYGEYKPDVKLWVWQLAPDGRVAGIHGEVDINVFNGYSEEFKKWLEEVRKK